MLTTLPFSGFYCSKWAVARYEDKAPPKNPNQMEMSV